MAPKVVIRDVYMKGWLPESGNPGRSIWRVGYGILRENLRR